LRGHQRLQQIGWLSAWRQLRGQPIPQFVERGLRGWSLEVRPVQLGRQTFGQRQRGAKARKGKI